MATWASAFDSLRPADPSIGYSSAPVGNRVPSFDIHRRRGPRDKNSNWRPPRSTDHVTRLITSSRPTGPPDGTGRNRKVSLADETSIHQAPGRPHPPRCGIKGKAAQRVPPVISWPTWPSAHPLKRMTTAFNGPRRSLDRPKNRFSCPRPSWHVAAVNGPTFSICRRKRQTTQSALRTNVRFWGAGGGRSTERNWPSTSSRRSTSMFRLVLLYWSLYLWDLPPGNEDDSSYNFFLKMNDAGLAGRAGGISSATVCVPCRLTSSWTRRNLPERNKRQFMTRQPAINERSKSQNDSAIYKLNKGRKRKCNRTTPGSRRSSHLNAKSNGKQTVGLVSPMTNGSAFTFHNLGPLGPMTPHAEQTNAHGAL